MSACRVFLLQFALFQYFLFLFTLQDSGPKRRTSLTTLGILPREEDSQLQEIVVREIEPGKIWRPTEC